MRSFLNILILLNLFFLVACKQGNESDLVSDGLIEVPVAKANIISFTSPQELVTYVAAPENGYYKEKEIDNIKYSALLKPIDFIKANEALKSDGIKVSDDDDLQYFDFRVTVKDFSMEFLKFDLSSPDEYAQRVEYCAFKMQKDIYLIDGKDTLQCEMFHFERAYDLVPYGHFILAFVPSKNKTMISPKTLVYHDQLFNKGLIKFTFTTNNLINVPKLSKL